MAIVSISLASIFLIQQYVKIPMIAYVGEPPRLNVTEMQQLNAFTVTVDDNMLYLLPDLKKMIHWALSATIPCGNGAFGVSGCPAITHGEISIFEFYFITNLPVDPQSKYIIDGRNEVLIKNNGNIYTLTWNSTSYFR